MVVPNLMFKTPEEIKTFRKKNGMIQADFWGRIGITQSGGSRYECDRNIPETVLTLLHLAYAPDDRA
ncbi:MAG: helix-turn-helix transcriptional regulator, partial [Proteobacteria bacterium]|nr:helix-turn-helix transcriptional regulator [Pseudomonadota bacterium]